MADLKQRVYKQVEKMNGDLLACQHILLNLRECRQGEDNWGDVGTLTMLAAKIAELRGELENYVRRRIPDWNK